MFHSRESQASQSSLSLSRTTTCFGNWETAHQLMSDESVQRDQSSVLRRFNLPPTADIIAAVSEQLGALLEPVRWLPGFFTLPQNVKIAGSEAYKKGQVKIRLETFFSDVAQMLKTHSVHVILSQGFLEAVMRNREGVIAVLSASKGVWSSVACGRDTDS